MKGTTRRKEEVGYIDPEVYAYFQELGLNELLKEYEEDPKK